MNKIKSIIVVAALSISFPTITLALPLDLSGWSEEGPGGGVWNVAGDNNSVTQSVNSSTPTFFISDDPFINSTFSGSIRVNTAADDDFIGFVFGYQTPFSDNGDNSKDMDFILFDWKQAPQSGGADEGFQLVRVNGDFSDNDLIHGHAASAFWDHDSADADSGEFEVLDSNIGGNMGWWDNTTYDFNLTYQSNLIEIVMDGGQFDNQTIFSYTGSFQAGSFGFYNYSQQNVTYAGVGAEDAPIPEPATVVLFGVGLAGLAGTRIRKNKK
jgi:hypothetical protein